MLNSIKCPDRGSISVRHDGVAEFKDFVFSTFKYLAQTEANVFGGRSSIMEFCRMDIGIHLDSNNNPSYFVNELERTPTTSLWLACIHTKNMTVFTDSFAGALRDWIRMMQTSFIRN